MKLSTHFDLDELTASDTAERLGIDNAPSRMIIEALTDTAQRMEEVRELLGGPIHVNSGYRCAKLNTLIGGSPRSAHMDGRAVDFTCRAAGSPLYIVRLIAASTIIFDSCIHEGSWVHISFDPRMRRHVLTAHFEDGKRATYTLGLE